MRLIETIRLCNAQYKPETLQHCLRVTGYVSESPCLDPGSEEAQVACLIALCHDLLEDTDTTLEEIIGVTGLSKEFLEDTLIPLTKDEGEGYNDYICRLKASKNPIAYIVKLADMKDHLMQTETLTDALREKYMGALPLLL